MIQYHSSGLTLKKYETRKKRLRQCLDNKTVIERVKEREGIRTIYSDGQSFYCAGTIVRDLNI
jgi:hypothetical protein